MMRRDTVSKTATGGVGALRLSWMALALASVVPAAPAQVVTSGSFAVSGAGVLLDGDQPAFQQRMRQRKDAFGGLENFSLSKTTDDSLFRFEARVIPGNEDYRLATRWEKFDAFYVEGTFSHFRTYYDGSGGRLLPRDIAFSWFDENLATDRSFLALELGTLVPDRVQWKLRYERSSREGTKNSIRWGDSNFAGAGLSPRAFVPSYYLLDEVRDAFVVEAGQRTEETNWRATGRYERTRFDNRHVSRRRPRENQERVVTTRDGAEVDLWSAHGFYERAIHETLRVSAGGLATTIDTDVFGSKIYGATPDAEYSPTFARRQAQDVGYYGLSGGTQLRQYVGNVNLMYQPTKYLLVRPGLKYDHLRQESGEQHTDTDFGGGAAAAAIQRQIESASRNSWNELTEELEVKFNGWADLPVSLRAQLNQGTGNLVEQSFLLPNAARVLDRETEYERIGHRYLANMTWYARPGLTVGASYTYRLKIADYDHRRDSTNNAGGFDRYPAFIVDNDVEAQEGSVRVSWRPASLLSFVTRYAHQRATVTTSFGGLREIENGNLRRHAFSQSATWSPTARLYFLGVVNLTYDQLDVPPHRLAFPSDNNYVSGSLGVGYAVGKASDLFLDLNHYRADNYTDNVTVTLPVHAGQTTQSAFLTWVLRQSETLVYTMKYGFARNRDGMFGGQNDFDAHIFYGKVQYKF